MAPLGTEKSTVVLWFIDAGNHSFGGTGVLSEDQAGGMELDPSELQCTKLAGYPDQHYEVTGRDGLMLDINYGTKTITVLRDGVSQGEIGITDEAILTVPYLGGYGDYFRPQVSTYLEGAEPPFLEMELQYNTDQQNYSKYFDSTNLSGAAVFRFQIQTEYADQD